MDVGRRRTGRMPDRRPLFAASAQSTQPIGNRLGGETAPGTFGHFCCRTKVTRTRVKGSQGLRKIGRVTES